MDPRHQDLISIAENWRKFRERYISRAGDNRIELNDFEQELYDYLVSPLKQMAQRKIITETEAQQWGSDILNQWVLLTIYARGRWWHKLWRWLINGR